LKVAEVQPNTSPQIVGTDEVLICGRSVGSMPRNSAPPTNAAAKAAYAVNQDELRRVLRRFPKPSKSLLTMAPKAIRRHSAWTIRKLPLYEEAQGYRRRRERVCAEV